MTVRFGLICISAYHSGAAIRAYGGSDTHLQKILSLCKHYTGPLYDECPSMGHNCPIFKLGINVRQEINIVQDFSSCFPKTAHVGACVCMCVYSYIELEILLKKVFFL